MIELIKFRVQKFRSVEDSGWVTAERVTSLIGTNEAGKTNLLIPLWKLNPAKDGAVNPMADYPRKDYNTIRSAETKPIFISAEFSLDQSTAEALSNETRIPAAMFASAIAHRDLSGCFTATFPGVPPVRTMRASVLHALFDDLLAQEKPAARKTADPNRQVVSACQKLVGETEQISHDVLSQICDHIKKSLPAEDDQPTAGDEPDPRATLRPLLTKLQGELDILEWVHPNEDKEAWTLLEQRLPKFVYYSHYGNLDSEIYLPHVIDNLKRPNLGSKEEAKARTLKVLFEFVKISPTEILELGKDIAATPGAATEQEITQVAARKKERDILLQSAGTGLTRRFKEWWKQGDYRFRFQADGDHFRIWVSDDRRPEDIELEGRSSGLQWFLSFYLVFLVESADTHRDAILLLDEPGLTLHALAQRDLAAFFDNLSDTNQIVFTTHSPFLVDPTHLDRVKAVYVDKSGHTAVSSNLRTAHAGSAENKSVYPVHAALGLTLSDSILPSAFPVLVEGPSDQRYLSAMRTILVAEGRIRPKRDMVFVPAGGTKGITAVAPIVSSTDETVPLLIVDSDRPGRDLAKKLRDGLYVAARDRIIEMSSLLNLENAEVEDLIPHDVMVDAASRFLRGPYDFPFADAAVSTQPIVPQIQAYAEKHGIDLQQRQGWKVEISDIVKKSLLKTGKVSDETARLWLKLFERLV